MFVSRLTNNNKQKCYDGKETNSDVTHGDNGDDEGDDEEDKADDHQCCHSLGPNWNPK